MTHALHLTFGVGVGGYLLAAFLLLAWSAAGRYPDIFSERPSGPEVLAKVRAWLAFGQAALILYLALFAATRL